MRSRYTTSTTLLPLNGKHGVMLFQGWPTVFNAGPTLKRHWVNFPGLLGYAVDLVIFKFLNFRKFLFF